MSKTLVCVNVLDNVSSQVYGSHCQEWFRLGRSTNDEFILFHPNRLSIDSARNQAAAFAMRFSCDYLYFVDDDVILSPNTYTNLKRCDADIAQALTFIRGYPFHCMAFKKLDNNTIDYYDDYYEHINKDGTVDCEAVGFSCALIKVSILNRINSPYFVTGAQCTEDLYFCIKLRQKLGSDVRIVVDTKVPTSHLLQPEGISVDNLQKMKRFYQLENNSEDDRGKEYLEKCKAQFQIVS